jgi:magnesium-transporting ATPase (P-type)
VAGRPRPNELPAAKKRNLAQQAWDVVREPMLLLLLGAGTVDFLLSEPLDGAILMSFVVVVIAISIYQEHKTETRSPRSAICPPRAPSLSTMAVRSVSPGAT